MKTCTTTDLREVLNARLEWMSLRLRDETPDDSAFICDLYADVRRDELAQTDWPQQAIADFLADQYRLQMEHYRKHYAGSGFFVIERRVLPANRFERVGRIYLANWTDELRIMETAIVRKYRGHGMGTVLMEVVLAFADEHQKRSSLHVEAYNPAKRLYQRLGFVAMENVGVYERMERPVSIAAALPIRARHVATENARG
jgi:GNAT superfamily N-acetyltransferase